MTVKCTIIMRQGTFTWTETHYDTANSGVTPSTLGNLTPSATKAAALASLRAQILGQGASIVRVRLSDPNVPRSSTNVPFGSYAYIGPFVGTVTADEFWAEFPDSCILMRANSAGGVFAKNMYVAGIPDGVIDTDPSNQNNLEFFGAFVAPFANYVAGLLSGWAFRVEGSANAPAPALDVVTSTQFPNTVGLTTGAALPGQPAAQGAFIPPFEVVLRGFRRSNTRQAGLQGRYQVVGVIPPAGPVSLWQYFLSKTGNVLRSNITALGEIQVAGFQYVQYGALTPTRAGRRKRGVRTGQPLGRSPSRA